MSSSKLTYRRTGAVISGHLANTFIVRSIFPAKAGRVPGPGVYRIHPPARDPIWGPYALMTPSGSAFDAAPTFQYDTSPTFQYDTSPTFQYDTSPAYQYDMLPKILFPSVAREGSPVFILSGKLIPGRNTLVVSVGLANLMIALRAAGGASVTVA